MSLKDIIDLVLFFVPFIMIAVGMFGAGYLYCSLRHPTRVVIYRTRSEKRSTREVSA